VVLIPAYRPDKVLAAAVETIAAGGIPAIIVVDDGSGPEFGEVFERVSAMEKVTVLRHTVNLGKGAALKTGIDFILCTYPSQHAPEDILKVCARFEQSPDGLVLGVRGSRGRIPLRSRLGNQVTRHVMRVVLGHDLTDTQTGLRAIPRTLAARLLKVAASRYEFELEMLIAARHLGIRVIQEPIRTIYEPGNPTSHFRPLRDSMRIYFVLLRFSFISILTATLDNLLFYTVFRMSGSLIPAQVAGRLGAIMFNYPAVRKAAFHSDQRHRVVLPRYLLLVAVNAVLSYAGIRFLSAVLPVGVVPAKLLAETLLFAANFVIQRDFVFTRRNRVATLSDWDQYYKGVPATTRFTRRYIQSALNYVMRQYAGAREKHWDRRRTGRREQLFPRGHSE
jgi:putative flippase GtrA